MSASLSDKNWENMDQNAQVTDAFWDQYSVVDLLNWTMDARRRTLASIADLSDEQLLGPQMLTVNPLLWEIGHVAWFQEKWVLRHCGRQSQLRDDADELYDSAEIAHDIRWDLRFPTRANTLAYMENVLQQVANRLNGPISNEDAYFHLLTIFHEDMHTEAFLMNRQAWGFRFPDFGDEQPIPKNDIASTTGDVEISGGVIHLGAARDEPFVFDNEKWAHPVELRPFTIARTTVTETEFAAFVDEGGYSEPRFWSDDGWQWRCDQDAKHPVYWRHDGKGCWQRRHFHEWVALSSDRPVVNVNWYEADAFCRWAKRRLPTECEWEAAASWNGTTNQINKYPWGDATADASYANLDAVRDGCVGVNEFGRCASPCGCCQMIGNVWEWTADCFEPYQEFVADPYREYSQPWFTTHKVLRGGSWATRSRLIRNTFRNFYMPDRRDVWAGFRTCALER